MALVTMKEVLHAATNGQYALGAFEFWSFESARAIVAAAESENLPVILQAGYDECLVAGNYQNLGMIGRSVADEAGVQVALHLDHGRTVEEAYQALEAGFTSVMIDASALPYEENARITREVAELARRYGATVEAELGRLAGSEAQADVSEEEAAQTDPREAFQFVHDTGIDCLAVAIGTAHGLYRYEPRINIPRLIEIREKVDIPLVLHGGSGTPERKIREAIANGIRKINICTELVAAFGNGYSAAQRAPDYRPGASRLYLPAYEAGFALAREKIRLFAGRSQ